MSDISVKALFLDIGGVFLTNGWGSKSRLQAAEKFSIDFTEMNERHRIIFDTYESGRMSLDEYLYLIVFYDKRSFTIEAFKEFMYSQSQSFPEMIQLITDIKHKYNLPTFSLNNESRELNEHRIKQFELKKLFDVFVSSCYIKFRKPDKRFYKIALDIAQVAPEEVVYIDDRKVFIQTAQQLGLNCIHHTGVDTTRAALSAFGLTL